MKKPLLSGWMVLLLTSILGAQTSENYILTEHAFNAGGDPRNSIILTSSNFQVTLDAVGDTLAGLFLTGSSYTTSGGFVAGYPPPGEVLDVKFADKTTLSWSPETSVGSYNLYWGDVSTLSSGYGNCKEPGITTEQIEVPEIPSAGQGYFYLVTANNLLDEEGIMGYDSSDSERPNSNPCP